MISALPVVPSVGCSSLSALSEICGSAGNLGSSILGAGAGDILGVIAAAVAQGASWLLGQIATVISSSTAIDLGASWFKGHYAIMVTLAAVVILPLLLASVVQSIVRQNASELVRTALVHLPLALLLGAVALQLVQLGLAATDAMSRAVSVSSSSDIGSALSGLAGSLASQATQGNASVPTFVTLLGALFVSFGALLLWVELLVRAAAVYVTTLFFPLALASLVWPSISQWCRRLVETLTALVLSKFVIVAILSLAIGALGTNDGSISSEMAGGALLLLAGFSPFTLLKLLPMVESAAVHQLEGARHRVVHGALAAPRSAVSFALAHRAAEALPDLEIGTGIRPQPELAGMGTGAGRRGEGSGPSDPSADIEVPMWEGTSESDPADLVQEIGPSSSRVQAPPIWGSGFPAPVVPASRIGTHVIERDELGPVLRWAPPELGRPSGALRDG